MTEKDRELMERYIYQVARRLPKEQKEETALELQELIEDMMEKPGSSMEEVLEKLGDPAKFAEQYQDRAHCLIGPEYYDTYMWFIKVVLLCSVIPILLVGIVDAIRTGGAGSSVYVQAGEGVRISVEAMSTVVMESLLNTVVNAAASGISVFGAVTLVFAVMERQKVKLEKKKEKEWKVEELGAPSGKRFSGWKPGALSPVPDPKARISRGDSIVSIVFAVVFGALLIFAPYFFSAVFRDGRTTVVVPIFNLNQWNRILPVFILSLLLGLADEVVRLAVGVYGKIVLVSNLVCNGISLVLAVILLKVMPFWNPDFAGEIGAYLSGNEEKLDFLARWNGDTASDILLAVIVLSVLLDSGMTIYKTLRYGRSRSGRLSSPSGE